jgi:hypothetical protein
MKPIGRRIYEFRTKGGSELLLRKLRMPSCERRYWEPTGVVHYIMDDKNVEIWKRMRTRRWK